MVDKDQPTTLPEEAIEKSSEKATEAGAEVILKNEQVPEAVEDVLESIEDDPSVQKLKSMFFDFPVAEVQEGYTTESKEPHRLGKPDIDNLGLRNQLYSHFDVYLQCTGDEIEDDFFEKALKLAQNYVGQEYEHGASHNKPEAALQHSQLQALLMHPVFIKDERSMPIYEALASLATNNPHHYEMFADYAPNSAGVGGRYFPRKGFDTDMLPAFERLVDNPKLWQEREFAGVLFYNIGQVLQLLDRDREATLPLRIKLLKMNVENGNMSEVNDRLLYTFESAEDKTALRELLVDEEPDSPLTEVIRKFLTAYRAVRRY
ncbi:hypothetical protein ACFL10_01510 [Patescibacteria group bacterium]